MSYQVEQAEDELTPQDLADNYCHAFRMVHQREVFVQCISRQWYNVAGETVHRLTLVQETERLYDLARKQRMRRTDKSLVQRLISKLRGM